MGGIWDAFMETMLSRLMLCLSILSSTASATWNLNTLEQGEVYMVVIPEHVSFVCPYGYTNGGFLAIEQTVNPVFKFRHLLRPDDGSYTSE